MFEFGPRYHEFEDHIRCYTEEEIWHDIKMVRQNSRCSDAIKLVWITYIERVHNIDIFHESLEQLSSFRFCKNNHNVIKSGPAMFLDKCLA